ncbi:phage tail tape measure protein [Ruminococcus sp. AM30-15AC]|nr:phage tail tape measure protein [Ruminococcus sp. AM30-15AC]
MAEDFRAKITAELDTAEAENKLNAFLNKKNKLKIDVEVNQDSAKKLSSSIEKGIRQTKLDTSSITEQLAGSFNISDKNVLSRMKKQMDTMVSSLGKTWNGSDFDFKNASGFYSGLNNLSDTVTKNAKIIQGKTGIYDDFFNYFKDKKIYVSDELKKAMGGDAYKELLQNNIGKIVRDSTKGVSIDSIWGEMTSLFPEHFSADMTTQVDQIIHAFDLMKQARADMTQSFSVSDLKGADFTAMTDSIAEQVLAAGTQLKDALQTNLMSATEAAKTMIDLDVEVNTEKIASDIRSAVQSAGTEAGEALNVDLKINDEQLISELRSAVGQLGTGEEPVKVNLQVDRESLQSDLNLTLNDLELPVHFKVDAEEIESQLRAAVESITDIQIDLRVNTDPVTDATAQAANTGNIQAEVPVAAPQTDTSGLTQLQQALGSVNTAGQRSQSIFSSLGSSFREAFSAYSLANLMQDGLYKITDAGKEALSTVKEFNDLETDLAMATGESRSYASDLTQSYNALGQELGSITSDVAKSADSWLRQGRSMSETNQLIKDSMVLSKDAQMDSENASEVLTATLNGFQMNADQAGHINDVLTSIDLESASDAGGIGQALTKVASQANNAGVSLEKTAAMIATIKDVTQDSDDSIGTGLKSILSRMNQIKAGKFVDSETGESLNDVEKVLNKVGISMRDVNGQFKESEPIIDEVAGKWSTFDGNTKKAVATAMAGTYQYNKLIAMFDNWDKVQSLTETALNADGTAQKKFEDNYLTSLEAKTNALKASLENLATSTVSSDLYSGFLDGSKSLVDFANNINLVQSAIAGLGAAGGVYAIQQIVAAFRELSNLGNALNLSRAVNIPDDSFQRLLTLTQGLSESQTRLVLSSTALTDAQRAAILTNQGMSSAEAQASVAAMGLSTAEGAAAASTFSLSGALSGLWATLMANPLILVAAGVTAAVSAFSAYQHSVEEAVSSAKQAGTEWQENNTSLQDNIERITELRTALSSGTLTEQEAASAKSELLSIQESLTDSYHSQVAGIDLINGSLEEQIALLDKVSQKEASQFQNENKKGIEEAEKKVEKKRHTYLGQFLDNGSKESEAIKKSINDLKKEYGDEVFTIEPEMDGITMDVHFKADSVTAKQALNDFMDDAKSIEKQYGESDTLSVMLDNASGGLSEANEILGKYGDLYEQAQEAKLVAEEQTFKANGKDQTALKWLNDYTKAVKNYNDALTEGDSDKITQAAGEFETVDTAVQSLLKNSDMSQFADQFSEVRDQLNDTAIAVNQFSDALSGKDTSKFGKEIKKNADSLKELGLTDTDFKYAFETEGVQEGEDQINALVDAAVECGLISDTSSGEVAKLVNMLTQLGVISSSAGASVDTTTEAVSDLADQIINAQEALSGIEKATSVLTSQSTGKSISLDDFNSDELSDYTSALEYNNGALHLNAEKVRELQKAKAEEAIQTNENQKLEKQAQYMQNIAEIERLRDELRNLSDAKSQNAQTIQSSIDALLSENDGLVNQCNQLDLLSASLREATGAYQNWLDKQNTSESGDMFDDAMGALDHIEDVTQNTKSDDYGRIGTNSYKAAVDFIVPDSVDTEDAEAVSSYIDSIEHYFNHDSDGNRTGLDVAEFCAKATKAGLMELDEASGEYKVAGQRTMQDFADGLNLSLPMVQAMFGEMEEFGGEFDWADEAVKTLGDLGMAAGEAKGRIEELSGDKDLDIQIDVSDIDNTEDKIKTLDNTIQQMQDYKGTLEVDSSQVDDANTVIQYCVTQKQMLEAPAVMSVDASQVDGELGNALSLLQQFQEVQNNVELQAAVGADTSEAQGKVDGLVSEIQGLNPEIKATLGINGDSEATITASIQALSPKIMVEAGVDSTVVDAYAAEEKKSNGTVEWDNNTGKVDAWAAQMHTSNGTVNWTNNTANVKTSFTATGTVNWTNANAPSKGSGGASGTAHAFGTAHYPHLVGHADAKGNWGTKTGGMTLVGELGREIVVDPMTGTWHTVGDNGAEFQYIPAGSIVFNHLQTESLLEQGFVNSRGMARASGTAMVRGGISVSQANIASGNRGSGTGNGSASTANTAAVNNNTKAVQSSGKAASEAADKVDEALQNAIKKLNDNAMDWIETTMNRLDRATSKYTDYAESDTSHYTKAQKNYDKAIKSTQEEIDASKQAMQKYWSYAQKVAADSTVSQYLTPTLKKKIDEGKTIDVESLSASQKAAVDAYKEWMDKYLDAKDTNREKRAQKLKLAKAKVDNTYDSYDVIIGKREAKEDYYAALAENRIAHGKSQKIGSVYYQDLEKQRDYAQYQKDWTSKEMKAVRKQMAEYLKTNGNNRKDKAYQEMLKQYTDLKTTYAKADTHIQELTQAIQNTREDVKQWSVDRWDRAGSKQDAAINYKIVSDNPDRQIAEKDYTERIKTNNRQILALQKLRQEKAEYYDTHFSSWNNEEAQKYLDSIAKIDEQILNLGSSTEELKNKIMELRWKPFDDLQDKIDSVLTEYQTMQKLLGDEDSFYNDDGSLTENGLTNVLLLQESIDLTKDKLANYRVALDKLEEQYKNGCYSAEEYKEKTEELLKGIQNASSSLAEYRQQMISVYETQVKTENDLLQDNIDKRLEALDAKEKYYDYDKNIKKKSKDINALKSSIAALEGTTNAAARARLEKLKAELADAEEDMQDTVHQHEVEMKKTGYENLQEDAENALDNTLDALKKNTSFQEAVINNMLNNVKSNYDSTYKHLGDVMNQYGMKVSQTFDQMITKAADFNTAAVNATKAWEGVYKMDTSKIPGASNGQDDNNGSADKVLDDTLKKSDNSDDAGNVTPGKINGTTYSLKLNASEIYLTYSHLKYSLKATWSPSKPEHSDIEWKSSDESIAKVSSDGTVRGVSAGLGKNGLMSRDESKTRKCIITANGGPGLATAECIVHIMPDSHYEAIKGYAERAGKLETSGNNLRDSMEYAYKNGAFRSNQSSTAVEGFQKAYLKDWFNALPDRPNGATDVPSGVSQLAGYFYSKGKQVTRNDMQKLADILQIKTPGVGSYDTWGGTLKNKILKAYKAYGFSKGGVVCNGIPANILDMIGGDALIPREDSVLIGANPGETVLTKEFTDQLKPTVATLNAFNEMMAKPILSPGAAVQDQNTEIVAENHFIFNNPVIKSEEDAEKLMEKAIQKHMEKNKRDWKKVR